MEKVLRKYRGNPDGEQPTIEELRAQYEDELEAERKKVKDQNSYITKLEEERNKLRDQKSTGEVKPAPVSKGTPQPSAAEQYAINTATRELITEHEAKLKEKYGEEIYNEIKEDFVAIARTNIKDPFSVQPDLLQRAEQMAIGRAFGDKEKRVKIAGAFVIQDPQSKAEEPATKQEVVLDPAGNKINTLSPDDKQTLGSPNPNNPTGEKKRLSRQEFFAQQQKNKKVIR